MQNFKPQSTYCSHISDKFCRLSDDFKISENIQNTDDWQSSVIKKKVEINPMVFEKSRVEKELNIIGNRKKTIKCFVGNKNQYEN